MLSSALNMYLANSKKIDRVVDISKYPSYGKNESSRIIKIPKYEKTHEINHNIIPFVNYDYGVDPDTFDDQDEDTQKFLSLQGFGNKLEKEIQSMLPGSYMKNIFPAHLNDHVPKELRAVPTPFALMFADRNTFETTNPLLSSNKISGPLFSALAKKKLIANALKNKKDLPAFKDSKKDDGNDGDDKGGDNKAIKKLQSIPSQFKNDLENTETSVPSDSLGVYPDLEESENNLYDDGYEDDDEDAEDQFSSNFSTNIPDYANFYPQTSEIFTGLSPESIKKDFLSHDLPTGSNIVINPPVNKYRIVTFDEESRNTLDRNNQPEISNDPLIDNIFGNIPADFIASSIFDNKINLQINDYLKDTKVERDDENNEEYSDIENKKDLINKAFEEQKWGNVDDIDNYEKKYSEEVTGESIKDAIKSEALGF